MSPNNQQKISLMDFTEPLSRIPDGEAEPDKPNGSLLSINFTGFFFSFFLFLKYQYSHITLVVVSLCMTSMPPMAPISAKPCKAGKKKVPSNWR